MLSPIRRLAVWSAQQAYAKSETTALSERDALTRLSELLLRTDCDALNPEPYSRPTPGLMWLPCALRRASPGVMQTMLRPTIGSAAWRPAHPKSPWSKDFFSTIALGELIGPSGHVCSDAFRFGVVVFGPDAVYEEHAHNATEVYFVLGADLLCGRCEKSSVSRAGAGDFIVIGPNCRHDVRSEEAPVVALWARIDDVDASTFRRADGSWGGGERVAVTCFET